MSKTQAKKELAEAGRRKLEAFRKQKSEGKAKKSAPPSPALPSSVTEAAPDDIPQAPIHVDASTTSVTRSPMPAPLSAVRSPTLPPQLLTPPAPQGAHAGETSTMGLACNVPNGSTPNPTSGGAALEEAASAQRHGGAGAMKGGEEEEEPPLLPVSRPPKAADSPPGSISKEENVPVSRWPLPNRPSTLTQHLAEPERPSWLRGPPPLPRRPPEKTPGTSAPALPPLAPLIPATSAPKALPEQDAPPLPAPPPPPPPYGRPLPGPIGPVGGESIQRLDNISTTASLLSNPRGRSSDLPMPPVLERPSGTYGANSDAYLGAARGERTSTPERLPATGGLGPSDRGLEGIGEVSTSAPVAPGIPSHGVGPASASTRDEPASEVLQGRNLGPDGNVPTVTGTSSSGAPRGSSIVEQRFPLEQKGETPPDTGDLNVIVNGISVFGRNLQASSTSPEVTPSSSYAALSDSYLEAGGGGEKSRQARGDPPGPTPFGGYSSHSLRTGSSQHQATRDRLGTPASQYAALSDSYLQPAPPRLPDTEKPFTREGVVPGNLWGSAPDKLAKEPLFGRPSRDVSPGKLASNGKASSAYAALSDSYVGAREAGGALTRADATASGTSPLPAGGAGPQAADRAAWARAAAPVAPIAVPAVWTPLRGSPPDRPQIADARRLAENGGADAPTHSPGTAAVDGPFQAEANGIVGHGKEGGVGERGPADETGQKPPGPGYRVAQPPPKEPGNAKFAALQQYIDELTQEKFELLRGLEVQRKLAETLASENQTLTEDFNRQGRQMMAACTEADRVRAEVAAQQLALVAMAGERDACRTSVTEANERCKALAAEVVSLEERVLHLRSAELRLGKEMEEQRAVAKKAAAQVESAMHERDSLAAAVEALREQQKVMGVRLRETMPPGEALALRSPRDASTQTAGVLHAELATPSSPGQGTSAPASVRVSNDGDAAREAGPTEHDGEAAAPAEASSARIAAAAMRGLRTGAQVATPRGALPLALQPLLPKSIFTGLGSAGGLAGAAAAVVEESRATVANIHDLVSDLDSQKRTLLQMLETKEAELAAARAGSAELQLRLEASMQRLELVMQQSSFAAHMQRQASAASLSQPPGLDPPMPGTVRSAPPTPARRPLRPARGGQRRSLFGWVADIIAPPPESQTVGARSYMV